MSFSFTRRACFITLSSHPLNAGFRGRVASTRGWKSVRVLSLMGAITIRSPAESDGMIWVTRSCFSNARSFPWTLAEKSMKMTISVPWGVVACEEGAHPAVSSHPCMIRARIQAVCRKGSNESASIGTTHFTVQGNFRPPFQLGKLGTFSKGRGRQQTPVPHVGLTIQGDSLVSEGSNLFDLAFRLFDFSVHFGADPE